MSSLLSRVLPSPAETPANVGPTLRLLLLLIVVSAFLSRFSISVGSLDVRPEHLATVLLGGWLIASRPDLLRTVVRDPLVLLLATFVIWALFVTVLMAPDVRDSAPIVGWLALDVVLLASLLALRQQMSIVRDAVGWMIPIVAVTGIAAWVSARLLDTTWGVQRDAVHDINAAYATLHEANVFGAVLAVWAVFLSGTGNMRPLRSFVFAVLVSAGVLVSETRAAVLGLALGCLVLLISRAWQRPRAATSTRMTAPALVLVVLGALYGITATFGVLSASESTQPSIEPTPTPTVSQAETSAPSSGPATSSIEPSSIAATTSAEESTRPSTDKLQDFSPKSSNVEYRRLVAEIALKDMTGWRLVAGNGVDTFGQRHDDPTLPGVPGYLGSLPLQVLYDTGLVGVALLAALVITLVRTARRENLPVVLGSVTAFAVTSTFTSTLWFATTWLLVGCLDAMRER